MLPENSSLAKSSLVNLKSLMTTITILPMKTVYIFWYFCHFTLQIPPPLILPSTPIVPIRGIEKGPGGN